MTTIKFRSPVTVPLLRQGTPKPQPPDPAAHKTFIVKVRFKDGDTLGGPGKHNAVDIGNFRCGDPIVAMGDGTAFQDEDDAKVRLGAKTNALGIIIDHGHKVTTEYWHLKGFAVENGKGVKAGDRIGFVGDTGAAKGCHCHIEFKVNGKRRDPEPFMFGLPLPIAGRTPAAPTPRGGGDMALKFKAADYKPMNNRQFLTDIGANFRAAPRRNSAILKAFPGNVKVFPSGVVKGEAVQGRAPTAGFANNQWLEARMNTGGNIELGYFHASTLTSQSKVE